jgi:hypothetical protein
MPDSNGKIAQLLFARPRCGKTAGRFRIVVFLTLRKRSFRAVLLCWNFFALPAFKKVGD